jgi:transposase
VLVAVEAADFRRGIDGLAQLCRASLRTDPFTGTLFVFRNRRRTAIKLLVYDSCEAPRYVKLVRASRLFPAFGLALLHITRFL